MTRPLDPWHYEERHQQRMEDTPHIYCDICGDALYEADTYYNIGGEVWCPLCVKRELRKRVNFD